MMLLVVRKHVHSSIYLEIAYKRFFFASSTDHTRLLLESQVHRLEAQQQQQNQKASDTTTILYNYVLAAGGLDLATVKKVPQLHLARLYVRGNVMFGAKVVNRTLGDPVNVCGRLVDAAVVDIRRQGHIPMASSTIHGLSDWILNELKQATLRELIAAEFDSDVVAVITAIACNKANETLYESGKMAWEKLARDYVKSNHGLEAALYQSKGGKLLAIEHNTDKSEYASMCGGAMALFAFDN